MTNARAREWRRVSTGGKHWTKSTWTLVLCVAANTVSEEQRQWYELYYIHGNCRFCTVAECHGHSWPVNERRLGWGVSTKKKPKIYRSHHNMYAEQLEISFDHSWFGSFPSRKLGLFRILLLCIRVDTALAYRINFWFVIEKLSNDINVRISHKIGENLQMFDVAQWNRISSVRIHTNILSKPQPFVLILDS